MRYLLGLFFFFLFLIFSCSYKSSKNELSVFIDGSAKWIKDEKNHNTENNATNANIMQN